MELTQQENLLVGSISAFKAKSDTLMLEGQKADQLLKMMNSCSDNCKLSYKENGIQNQADPQVACYSECVTKAYKLRQ